MVDPRINMSSMNLYCPGTSGSMNHQFLTTQYAWVQNIYEVTYLNRASKENFSTCSHGITKFNYFLFNNYITFNQM